MADSKEIFWSALGALTYAETQKVAETMRDAWDCLLGPEPTDAQDWAAALNTAREIAQDRLEDAV